MKKVVLLVITSILLVVFGYGLYVFFSQKPSSEIQRQDPSQSNQSDSQKNTSLNATQEVTQKSFLVPLINIAKLKANDAFTVSTMASIIPEALIFADNHQNSLAGFIPKETSCDTKPIVRLVPGEFSDPIVFAKQCIGGNYTCYDAKGVKTVSAEFALNEKNIACGGFSEPLALSEIHTQEQAIDALSGKISYGDVLQKMVDGIRMYAKEHQNSFKDFSVRTFFAKELSSEDMKKSDDELLTIKSTTCDSKIHIDIAPDGMDFVIHIPLCEMLQYSACIDRDTPVGDLYVTETDIINKTYHCK